MWVFNYYNQLFLIAYNSCKIKDSKQFENVSQVLWGKAKEVNLRINDSTFSKKEKVKVKIKVLAIYLKPMQSKKKRKTSVFCCYFYCFIYSVYFWKHVAACLYVFFLFFFCSYRLYIFSNTSKSTSREIIMVSILWYNTIRNSH